MKNITKNKPTARVIYIAGYGYSGSTILEILLSSSNEIIGLGELVGIPRELNASFTKSFLGENSFCRELYGRIETALEKQDESLHSITELSKYEHFIGLKSKKRKFRYHRFWSTFLKTAGENPSNPVTTFVDSSKTALAHAYRPYHLQSIDGIDVSIVHIVRHPRSILNRFKKKVVLNNKKGADWLNIVQGISKAFFNWTFASIWPAIFSHKSDKYVRISFENLREFPVVTLKKIEKECQLDLSDSIDRVKNNKPLPPTCGIAGNIPVKKQEKELRFQPSKKVIPKTDPILSLLSLTLLPVYKLLTR